jgi:glycosyltransferase involved in cell wall biosynthesis
MKAIMKGWIRILLANPRAVAAARKILRPFPAVEEEVRVWIYLLKKNLFRSNTAPPLTEDNQPAPTAVPGGQTLLIDISELVLHDVHTGIQRVVRSLLQELLRHPPAGYAVEAVYADAASQLRYARRFASAMLGQQPADPEEPLVSIHPGDVFFCPDLYLNSPFATLAALKPQGLRVVFTNYDIIALNNPELFPKAIKLGFTDWFTGVMKVADAVVCDSRAVADELESWLDSHPGLRRRSLPIGYFHLGADLKASQPTQGPRDEGAEVLAACQSRPTLLMVGTLEPRKGHAQALAAIELLWEDGIHLNLVIVGKEGWRSHDLVRRLRRHPERNQRLFWLEKASDALLMQLYAQSTALLAASYAEGFGLPLIEAAHYGLSIIARDIPVFHEVAGEFAFYFPDTDSAALADSLRRWLQLHTEGKAPQSRDMPYLTWAQSTRQILHVILENDWYTTYQPADERETISAE